MDDDDVQDCKHASRLNRIARALSVPVESLYNSDPPQPLLPIGTETQGEDLAQALAVMRLFLRLKDPEARARCVGFIAQELTNDR